MGGSGRRFKNEGKECKWGRRGWEENRRRWKGKRSSLGE